MKKHTPLYTEPEPKTARPHYSKLQLILFAVSLVVLLVIAIPLGQGFEALSSGNKEGTVGETDRQRLILVQSKEGAASSALSKSYPMALQPDQKNSPLVADVNKLQGLSKLNSSAHKEEGAASTDRSDSTRR